MQSASIRHYVNIPATNGVTVMATPPAASAEDTGKGSLESCCLAKKSCRNDRLAYAQILPAVNVSPGNSVHIGVVSAFWRAAAKETDDRGSALVAPQRKRERAADREQQQDEAGDRHRTQYQAAALAALDAGGQAGKDDRRLDRSDRDETRQDARSDLHREGMR
jgi:hypothetical protein